MPPALDLEDEGTWPAQLKRSLDDGLPTLRAFYEEESRVERLQRDDVMMRINPPPNPYHKKRDEIFDAVGQLLTGLSVVGWHCTRLCNDEIGLILSEGMYPLSSETFAMRLGRRIKAGDVPRKVAARFLNEHQANHKNRQMLWFIFSRGTLRDEHGVGRQFSSWGGEALYNSHEDDAETGLILRSIGKPCIVEAALPLELIEVLSSSAEWIARALLRSRGINAAPKPKGDGHIREKIGPERIRRLISIDDADFDALTGSSNWMRYPLRGPV